MLRALVEHGVQADLIVGSSVGAINSVFFAADPTIQGVRRLENIWRGLRRKDVFPMGLTGLFRWLAGGQGHVFSPVGLERLLLDHLPVAVLEQTAIPVCVIATDVLRGTEVRLRSGPALPALMASTAIPGLFPPVRIGGRLMVDGAVSNHTPISVAISLGATRVVVLPAGYPCARPDAPRGGFAMALHALNVMTAQQLARDVERYRGQAQITVIPPLCPLMMPAYDFAGCEEIIDRAGTATAEWLGMGGLDAVGAENLLVPHHHEM